MSFKDYAELVEPLVLPINGKQYTIPELGIADGAALTEHLDPNSVVEPMPDKEFSKLMLGSAYDDMLADNVPGGAISRASMAALADFQAGRATAEVMWETGGDPKAIEEVAAGLKEATAPNRAARHKSTRTAAASTTKRPASTSGTKTSPTS